MPADPGRASGSYVPLEDPRLPSELARTASTKPDALSSFCRGRMGVNPAGRGLVPDEPRAALRPGHQGPQLQV